jgi:hypothetical protein
MATELLQLAEKTKLDADEIAEKTRLIYDAFLGQSPYVDGGNFTRIHSSDLKRLFDQYDRCFFGGHIGAALGDAPLKFGLSKRMTSAGGKTVRYRYRHRPGQPLFEISVSTTLLFQCFSGHDHRPITASGIVCRDRLEALQRVIEHEMVHLIELLLWSDSSCAGRRFQSMALRFFGHTEHKHQLITPRERAFAKFGIKPGDRVRFRFDGAEYTGLVNRITRRATVLVEDNRGTPYSDGKRYAKFYVPVELLEAVE